MPLVVPGLMGGKDKNSDWQNKLMGKKIGDTSDEVVCLSSFACFPSSFRCHPDASMMRGDERIDVTNTFRRPLRKVICRRNTASSRRAICPPWTTFLNGTS
jgi:hypothetical protein